MRKYKYIILVLSLALLLVACDKKKPTEKPPEDKPDTTVEKDSQGRPKKDPASYPTNDIDTNENYKVESDGTKVNTSPKMLEEHVYDKITATKMEITTSAEDKRIAVLVLTIKNTSNEDIKNQGIKITFYDNNNKEQAVYLSQINSVEVGETTEIKNNAYERIINAYDYSIEFIQASGTG